MTGTDSGGANGEMAQGREAEEQGVVAGGGVGTHQPANPTLPTSTTPFQQPLWPLPQERFQTQPCHHRTMSRMTTRISGVRPTDGSIGITLDKLKETAVLTDVSASSVVKRSANLFTEADKDALQPGTSIHSVKEVARDLLAAGAGDKSQQSEGSGKATATSGETSESLQKGKEDVVKKSAKHDDEEEDDSYLSDDPEERYDAHAKSEVAQRIRFAIVLLIPIAFKPEATRVQATLRVLFNLWKKDPNMEIQATTKFQEVTALFLNKKQYCRLQVHAADPLLVEVLFKGVDAVITLEKRVKVKLEMRGQRAFKEGCCFHRVVNPVTGMEMDKVKGMVKEHDGDLYRWQHLIEDPTSHDKQLLVHYSSLKLCLLFGRAMADPGDDNLQAMLTSRQALLRRYRDGWRSFLELRTGFKVQLCGEAPTGFLSALAKSRKAKAGIKELVWDGVSHTDARAILETATRHFREAFNESFGLAGVESELQWTPRTVVEEAYAEALIKDWTEEEVKKAIKELANDKSLGRDGLPKELFCTHWDVLNGPVMKMVREFVAMGKMPEVANEAVTVLLYRKGAETNVQVYLLDDLLWKRMEVLLENFVSANQADMEKHFQLWSGVLMYTLREEGGIDVVDSRGRIDSVALRCVGLGLLQGCSLRREVTEEAAGLPLGWATLYTHKAVL
ncbi:unnamed protein product [Closterium sp. NIES-54]